MSRKFFIAFGLTLCVLVATASPSFAGSKKDHRQKGQEGMQGQGYTALGTGFCDISNSAQATTPCSVGADEAIGADGKPGNGYIAARSMPLSKAGVPIHQNNYCYYIDNNSSDAILVPFKWSEEWLSFVTSVNGNNGNKIPGIVAVNCAVEGNVSVPSSLGVDSQCLSATPSAQTISIPYYARYTDAVTHDAVTSFNCISAADGVTQFAETANVTVKPQDSGDPVTRVGWAIDTVTHTYDGGCGTANGQKYADTPSDNLCAIGETSGAGVDDPKDPKKWLWTCKGGDGVGSHDASCSADYLPKIDGACGAANGVASDKAPTTDLCLTGTPSSVSGGGGNPWTWACKGINGGKDDNSCQAPYKSPVCTVPGDGGPFGFGWTNKHGVRYNYPFYSGTEYATGNSLNAGDQVTHYSNSGDAYLTYGENIGGYGMETHCYTTVVCRDSGWVRLDNNVCDHVNNGPPGSCFPPDTPVLTVDRGWVAIVDVKIGDKVVSLDKHGHKTVATVTGTQVTPDRYLRAVNGVKISTRQKMMLAGGGHKTIADLKIGDILVGTDGTKVIVKTLEDIPGLHTVYNLKFDDPTTPFFAGGLGVFDWN